MPRPVYIYDNWSSYDELSDDVPLTEELALFELEQVKRLKDQGVKFDAYLMDAFWYTKNGGYSNWRKERWPRGPEKWLDACHKAGLMPGLWFPANTAFQLDPPDAWRDSLDPGGWGFCCFEGGFMEGFLGVLAHWYARGARVFKFDFAEFNAAPAGTALGPSEIRRRNVAAYRHALARFKKAHSDAILTAYNGFEDAEYMPWTDRPPRPVLDRAWLDVFDSIYCGDPRPADLPLPDFWRTLDVYADSMIHFLGASRMPLERIDNCAFMIGSTGTCYRRGSAGWFPALLLSLARGGRIHMALGNLEALTQEDACAYASAQVFYEGLTTPRLHGNPQIGEIYSYAAGEPGARVRTVVNPSLERQTLSLPRGSWHLLYADGHVNISGAEIELGPGAVALVSERHTDAVPGITRTGALPARLTTIWGPTKVRTRSLEFPLHPRGKDLHVVLNQMDKDGSALRTTGGAPPQGTSIANLLKIEAWQGEKEVPVIRPDDKAIWSGLSWAYGIIRRAAIKQTPLRIRVETDDERVSRLAVRVLEAD